MTRDGTHCGYGLAEYTAACCYYESLIAPRCGISVVGNSARIDVSDKKSKYPPVNVTDKNAIIAQMAAYMATKDMYHCQNPEDYTSIVNGVVKDSPRAIIYDMQGRRIDRLQRGLNMIRMSDGKTKKVIVNMGVARQRKCHGKILNRRRYRE